MGRGGKRNGSGRKPKAEELELIERLSPLEYIAFRRLEQGLTDGEFAYIKLFFEYRFGKPKESLSVKSDNNHVHRVVLEDVDGTEI